MTSERAADQRVPLYLRVFQTDLRIDCSHVQSRDALERAWSRCVTAPHDVEDRAVLPVPDVDQPLNASGVSSMGVRIAHIAAAQLDPSWLVVEAFGLADDKGRVILIAGPEVPAHHSALLDLCRGPLSYVGSDLLAVRGDGTVLACPKPVVQSHGRDSDYRVVVHAPDDLRLLTCPDRLRLARIVVLEPADGPVSVEGEELLGAMSALAPRVPSWRFPEHLLVRLARLVDACGGAHVVAGGDLDSVRSVLGGLLDAPAAGTQPWAPVTDRPANEMSWGLRDGRVRQMPYADAIETDGEVMVLTKVPARLGLLGATIWRTSLAGASFDQLEAAAVETHGPHPEAGALVRAAVADLTESDIVAHAVPLTLGSFLAGVRLAGLQPELAAVPVRPGRIGAGGE